MKTANPTKSIMPPLELLQESLDYNPETGEMRWKTRPLHHFYSQPKCDDWNRRWAGKEVGSKSYLPNGRKQYMQFGFTTRQDGRKFLSVHYVIFALEGITVPRGLMVDHEDGDVWNNRRSNLRIATPLQNTVNSVVHKDRIVDLPKNVYTVKNRPGFYARISVRGKRIRLGVHKTPELAAAAVIEADVKYNGEFARIKSQPTQ